MQDNLVTKEYLTKQLDLQGKKMFEQIKDLFDSRIERVDNRIDELALSIANEFKEVRVEIFSLETSMNHRFDLVDHHFEKVDAHNGRADLRMGHLDDVVVKDHTPRIRRIEGEIGI